MSTITTASITENSYHRALIPQKTPTTQHYYHRELLPHSTITTENYNHSTTEYT